MRMTLKLAFPSAVVGALTFSTYAAVAQDLNADLKVCRAIADVTARVACYDRLADGPPAATPRTPPPARADIAPPPPLDPAARFGEEKLPQERRPIPENMEADSITAKVTALTPVGYRMAISLDNGQVWSQVEGVRMSLAVGDTVTIKRGAMASYVLVPAGLNRAYRVTRSR